MESKCLANHCCCTKQVTYLDVKQFSKLSGQNKTARLNSIKANYIYMYIYAHTYVYALIYILYMYEICMYICIYFSYIDEIQSKTMFYLFEAKQ